MERLSLKNAHNAKVDTADIKTREDGIKAVLEDALVRDLEAVVVIGITKEGSAYNAVAMDSRHVGQMWVALIASLERLQKNVKEMVEQAGLCQ